MWILSIPYHLVMMMKDGAQTLAVWKRTGARSQRTLRKMPALPAERGAERTARRRVLLKGTGVMMTMTIGAPAQSMRKKAASPEKERETMMIMMVRRKKTLDVMTGPPIEEVIHLEHSFFHSLITLLFLYNVIEQPWYVDPLHPILLEQLEVFM